MSPTTMVTAIRTYTMAVLRAIRMFAFDGIDCKFSNLSLFSHYERAEQNP